MICSTISNLLGFTCQPLSDDGNVAFITTPFVFQDGATIPVFVENVGEKVRFFDDGETILHLRGRGLALDDHRKTKFLKSLAESNSVSLSDLGEIEIWSNSNDAPAAFAKYVSTMLALVEWESDQMGTETDIALLIDEVAMCLKAISPNAEFVENPEYVGISGYKYKLDFTYDGKAVIAISPHHAAVSSAAKKLLDIKGSTEYDGLNVMVVIDDRRDPDAAKKDGLILDSLANVWMMTRLEKRAGANEAMN